MPSYAQLVAIVLVALVLAGVGRCAKFLCVLNPGLESIEDQQQGDGEYYFNDGRIRQLAYINNSTYRSHTNGHDSCWNGMRFKDQHTDSHDRPSVEDEQMGRISCDGHACTAAPFWAWWSQHSARCYLQLIDEQQEEYLRWKQEGIALMKNAKNHIEHEVENELIWTNKGLAVWVCEITPSHLVPHSLKCTIPSFLEDETWTSVECTLDCHISWKTRLTMFLYEVVIYCLTITTICFLVVVFFLCIRKCCGKNKPPYSVNRDRFKGQPDNSFYTSGKIKTIVVHRGSQSSSMTLTGVNYMGQMDASKFV